MSEFKIKKTKPKVTIGARVSEDTLKRLKKEAKKNGVSVSLLIEHLIVTAFFKSC